MCPVIGWPMGWPVVASQSRTVLSELPDAIRLPSGLNPMPGKWSQHRLE